MELVWAYLALQGADLEGLEGLTSLIGVADVLESLSRVLATDIEEDLLTAAVVLKITWLANRGSLQFCRGCRCLQCGCGCGDMNGIRGSAKEQRREKERAR